MGGWVGGWVVRLNDNNAKSVLPKVEVKVQAELGNISPNENFNLDKTKLMLFDPSTSRDFMPKVRVSTLLELICQKNQSSYIVQRCN